MILEYKKVTYKSLKVGQKIQGVSDSSHNRHFTAYVKSITPAYVTVEMWRKGGKEEKFSTHYMFEVPMSEKEFNEKYRDKAKEVLEGIIHKLSIYEIGTHEMWNAWLYGSPYKIAKYCVENDMKVVGYCTDIVPKKALFSNDTLDCAVCAEYSDGDRMWCHYRFNDIKDMFNDYADLLK